MGLIRTVGRVLLASIFITGGYSVFTNPDPRATKVDKAGIPEPRSATILNGATMMIGGTALALDFFPKLAALVLAAALIPTTFVGHPFWQEETMPGRMNQQTHFLKNLAMLGGLLIVLAEK